MHVTSIDMAVMSDAYLTDYEKHLGQLRAHLSGNTGQPLSASFIQPTGYWTSREKDSFFRALCVYSRLRPDLIADSIKSKNVLDVCAYIDILDAAAAAQPAQTSAFRSKLEAAMEVSDSWVQYEEEEASVLANSELGWERAAEEHRRSLLLATSFQADHAYWSWKEEQERQWEKQDALAQLNVHHLRIMGRLIRDPKLRQFEPPLTEPPTLAHAPLVTDVPTPRFHDAILHTSEPSPMFQHLPSQARTTSDPGPSCTPERYLAHTLPSSSSNKHRPPADTAPTALSPRARTLLRNRLKMRERRAKAAGTQANMTPTKLQGARAQTKRAYLSKPRSKRYKPKNAPQERDSEDGLEGESPPPTSNTGPFVSDSIPPTGVEDNDNHAAPNHRKGGVTEPYKILSAFKDHGIDGSTLVESGLDIFNLPAISKLMRLFHIAYADPDEMSAISSVSFGTIELLRDILFDFTSTVVHCAISLREQEIILKRKVKVWRLENEGQITEGNVLDALQMHGWNTHNLLSDFPKDGPADCPSIDDDGPDDVMDSTESLEQRPVENESLTNVRLPLHQELLPAFVALPRTSESPSILPADTDMDELLVELDDEAKLDKLDRQLEAHYEKNLWRLSMAE